MYKPNISDTEYDRGKSDFAAGKRLRDIFTAIPEIATEEQGLSYLLGFLDGLLSRLRS